MIKVTGISKSRFATHTEDLYFDEVLIDDKPIDEGGGGGDFSVANVTFVNNTTEPYVFAAPSYIDEGEEVWSFGGAYAEPQRTSVVQVILYKGVGFASLNLDSIPTMTASGAIEVDAGDLIITGDGTVTISE